MLTLKSNVIIVLPFLFVSCSDKKPKPVYDTHVNWVADTFPRVVDGVCDSASKHRVVKYPDVPPKFSAKTPKEAYGEGYDNGYEDGYEEGYVNNENDDSYDDSCPYKGRMKKQYKAGYEIGYRDGNDDGLEEYANDRQPGEDPPDL